MLNLSVAFPAFVVAVIGSLILWSNPRRIVNRIAFTCSLHITTWLACLGLTLMGAPPSGLFWLRLTVAVSASLPLHFLVIKGAVSLGKLGFGIRSPIYRWFWILASIGMTIIPFTGAYIPADSTPSNRLYGFAYYNYDYGIALMYVLVFWESVKTLRSTTGVQRLELQAWLLGGCATAATILLMKVMRTLTGNPLFVQLYPFAALLYYGGLAFAVTTNRIMDARQLMLVALEKVLLVLVVAMSAYLLEGAIKTYLALPDYVAIILTTVPVIGIAFALNRWLNLKFHFYPEATSARKAAFDAAKAELRVEGLEQAFLPILRGWGQSEQAVVLSGPKEEVKGSGISFPADAPMIDVLRRIRWATPERLTRERTDPHRAQIADFMATHNLGVLVCSRGLSLTVLVGVGMPISRRPFTYPQVVQLMELTEIIESALERAHFSMQAQQSERLATVGLLGAGVAHEIRNPLVTIKTFVQLLPQRHQEEGFRRKFFQLISEEITRIDRLTERLMELGSPRSYFMLPQPLHPLVRGTLELVEPKAADRGIEITTDFQAQPDVIHTDAAAARQVLLNLCLNAVHAMESSPGPRRIHLCTGNVAGGVEVRVVDTGPGLASEMVPRLFAPFQSTKSTGFGLGLAISSEIMSGLKGTISADPPRAGEGATFRLIFPCPPPSS